MKINNANLTPDDTWLVLHQEVEENKFSNHSIESINDFYAVGIGQIMTKVFDINHLMDNTRDKTPADRLIKKIRFQVSFDNIKMKAPVTAGYCSGKEKILTPITAHIEDRTYSSNLYVDVTIRAWAYNHDGSETERESRVLNFRLANIPTMVGSDLCNLNAKSKETLVQLHEDPRDARAYFIKNGKEWAIDNIESIAFNQPRIFNNAWRLEIQRLEFISKPGDTYQNSKQVILRMMNNGALTLEIVTQNLRNIQFPFYLIFRALGWTTDKEMLDNVLYGHAGYPTDERVGAVTDSDILFRKMYQIIEDAINAPYDTKTYKFGASATLHERFEVLTFLVKHMPRETFKDMDFLKPEHIQQAVTKLLKHFDEDLLPHIGMDETARPAKLRFLGHLINRMMYVRLGLLTPTDRDGYTTKRVHTVGISLGKAFKTHFNASIVNQVRKQFIKDFKAMSFASVNLQQTFQISVNGADFERLLMQSITSATQTTLRVNKHHTIINRLSSQLLDRKNYTKIYSTLRMIISPNSDSSKSSDRAKDMRMPHPSSQGFICYVQSAEGGEKIGLHKQMGISASICSYGSSELLKQTIMADTVHFVKLANVAPYNVRNMAKVLVNGDWIGCSPDSAALIDHYTLMRRMQKIDKFTTLEWDNVMNEVNFWVDYGRPRRPVIIVYNNIRDWRALGLKAPATLDKFEQGVGLTPEVMRDLKAGRLRMEDLLKMHIVEYLTPQEQVRMDFAADINHLNAHRNDPLRQFSYCDVPEAMFGIAALTGPLANYNQTPRNTFQTSQVRQTGGYYAYNWAHRLDKDTFLQYQVEQPLVYTRINDYIPPNGAMCIVAVACYSGYNEEDSLVWNKATSERLKFNGSWFTYDKVELEKNEDFANPDVARTTGIKNYANYGKLGKNGIVAVGTIVRKGDVVVGKVKRLPKNIAEEKKVDFIDQSLVYKMEFPAIVHNVVIAKDDDATTFAKIAYRSMKPIIIGDKFCRREAAEVLTKKGWIAFKELTLNDEVATLVNDSDIVYCKPEAIHKFECVDEDMYSIKSQQIHEVCTMNHKMYVKRRDKTSYELIEARNVMGKRISFKKDGHNINQDYNDEAILYNGKEYTYPMDAYLRLLGQFVSDGWVQNYDKRSKRIVISAIKPRKILYLQETCRQLGIELTSKFNERKEQFANSKYQNIDGKHYINNMQLFQEFLPLSVGATNKYLPDWCMDLSERQSRIIIETMLDAGDGTYTNTGSAKIFTSSKRLANQLTQLALHAGWSASITVRYEAGTPFTIANRQSTYSVDALSVDIVKSKNNPTINHGHIHEQNGQDERIIKYTGTVMCITVPSHVFYCRENTTSPGSWTGNSARSG
jgi:DNA-directed RNA polymerase beta subunit